MKSKYVSTKTILMDKTRHSNLLKRGDSSYYFSNYYEAIDEKTYRFEVDRLGKLSFTGVSGEEAEIDKFCNNDVCEIPTS